MPGHIPFLAAIVANPDDDLPRLVFADWLEENGDSDRAEFIRLQIEKRRTKEEKQYPRPITDRIAQLKAANEEQWRAELPPLPGVTWGRFWRGFIGEVRFANPAALLEHAATAFAATPVCVVQVTGLEPDTVDAVCQLPQLTHLYGLRLNDVSLETTLWQTLTECEWFGRLRHLIVHPVGPARWSREYMRQEEELVRLVVAAATRDGSQLKLAHLEMATVPEDRFAEEVRGRLMLTGLRPSFDPL